MKGRAQKIRLGIFIMVSSFLLLVIIGVFTARRLFEKTDIYYVAYEDVSVSGLESGSPVKYLGITVGNISDIYIDPGDVNRVIVRLSMKTGTPIKDDASANIVAMGITGLKTIEITGGSNEAAFLPEKSFIKQGTSLVDDISGKAEIIAYKVEEVLNNLIDFTKPENLEKISNAIQSISVLVDTAANSFYLVNQVIADNRNDFRQIFEKTNNIAGHFDTTSIEFLAASRQFNRLMQSDTLSRILSNLQELSVSLSKTNLNELIENLALAVTQTQQLIIKVESDMDRGSQELTSSLILVKQTLENIEEATRKINTDPSILIRGQRARDIPDKNLQ